MVQSGASWGKVVRSLLVVPHRPMSSQSNEPIYYNSTYRHGIDEKRRLQIPAKWRPAEGDFRFTCFLWPHGTNTEACLLVLPPDQMLALVQKLRTLSYGDAQTAALRRILGSRSDELVLDKSGRVCLPEAMAKGAGIRDEALLVGLLDRFEIWSPERYDAASRVDDSLLNEAFKLI